MVDPSPNLVSVHVLSSHPGGTHLVLCYQWGADWAKGFAGIALHQDLVLEQVMVGAGILLTLQVVG